MNTCAYDYKANTIKAFYYKRKDLKLIEGRLISKGIQKGFPRHGILILANGKERLIPLHKIFK